MPKTKTSVATETESAPAQELTNLEILDADTPIAAYNPIKTAIATLGKKYANVVFDVSTVKGLDAAKAARAEIRDPRYKVEHIRKALKAPALAYAKRIDTEAEEYTTALLAIETPIDDTIKAEESRKEAEKAERERIENERLAAIQVAIDAIGAYALQAVGKPSDEIVKIRLVVAELEITLESFGQRAGEALSVQASTLKKIDDLFATTVAQEEEKARLLAEREELARQKKAQEVAAAEARRIEEARIAAERAALAAEQAKIKKAQNAEASRLQAEREAAAEEAAAERARQAVAQAAIDQERAKLDAEKAAAAKAAQDRVDAEFMAAKQKADAERQAQEAKAHAEAGEAARRARVKFEQNGPGQDVIIQVLADHYGVSRGIVSGWLSRLNIGQSLAA